MKSKGKITKKRSVEKSNVSPNSKTKMKQPGTNISQKKTDNVKLNLKSSNQVKKESKKENKSRSNSQKSRNSSNSKSPPSKTQKSIKKIINIVPTQSPAATNNMPIYFENIKKYENFLNNSVIHGNFGSDSFNFNDFSKSDSSHTNALIHSTNDGHHHVHYYPSFVIEDLNNSNLKYSDISSDYKIGRAHV